MPRMLVVDEGVGAVDRSIDVALGGEVDDGVDRTLAQQPLDGVRVADIPVDEIVGDAVEAGAVAGVGQRVEDDDRLVRMRRPPEADEVRADEAGTTGDEKGHASSLIARRQSRSSARQWRGMPVIAQVALLSSTPKAGRRAGVG